MKIKWNLKYEKGTIPSRAIIGVVTSNNEILLQFYVLFIEFGAVITFIGDEDECHSGRYLIPKDDKHSEQFNFRGITYYPFQSITELINWRLSV